ncbi:hypothetical protein LWI29_005030 [Acer saccharum]|uniref:RNase H type-1 domain-containing protein n=1 Tax=Acer saccharum TaxID=4024 RepID=A0AA39RX99_ACESA|nr:hypothetical protein LWI29_005030 [Acer saccharum]
MSGDLHFHDFIFWRIWFCRNQLVHNLVEQDVGFVVNWACNFIVECKATNLVHKPSPSVDVGVIIKWKPLDAGFFKINTDAAIDYLNQRIGIGVIIRDNSGVVRFAAVQNLKATFSPLVAEAMAVKCGIISTMVSGNVPFQIETDSLHLVNHGVVPFIDLGIAHVDALPYWSICHVPRKGNMAAHNLARMALSVDSDLHWVNAFPPCKEKFVNFDASF